MSLPVFRSAIVVYALFLQFSGSVAFGQTFRGAINGSVTDPSGAAIAGAKVTATENATQARHDTVSTSDGDFSFQDLPTGPYTVIAGSPGFQQTTVSGVEVTAGAIYTVPVKLSVGAQSSTVEVSAAAVEVDTTTSTQTDTIPSAALQDLPLNGRDFSQLIAVSPGYGGYSVGGLRIAQRNARQSDELADRRHR